MPETVVLKDINLFGSTAVDNRFIEEYMPNAPAEAVKVYLYGLMLVAKSGGNGEDIAQALSLSEDALFEAYGYWEKLGLVSLVLGENGNVAVRYLPLPSPAEGEAHEKGTQRYSELIAKLQEILGTRNFSGAELQRIYDWIEVFRFEEDAACAIVAHCIAIKGARVHINYMDSVAKRLAADGILTLEAVRESFERETALSGGAAAILKRWNVSRRPTEDELRLYDKWTREWGFTEDAIDLALSDVVAVDRPNFKYLDAILASYKQSGSVSADRMKELIREQDMIAEIARQAFTRAGLKRTASANDRRQFEFWFHEYGMNAELILFAAELASKKATPFAEMKRIITDWHSRGIVSIPAAKEDAAKAEAERERGSARGKRIPRALNYEQTRYTAEDLKRLGIDLGEGVYED